MGGEGAGLSVLFLCSWEGQASYAIMEGRLSPQLSWCLLTFVLVTKHDWQSSNNDSLTRITFFHLYFVLDSICVPAWLRLTPVSGLGGAVQVIIIALCTSSTPTTLPCHRFSGICCVSTPVHIFSCNWTFRIKFMCTHFKVMFSRWDQRNSTSKWFSLIHQNDDDYYFYYNLKAFLSSRFCSPLRPLPPVWPSTAQYFPPLSRNNHPVIWKILTTHGLCT